MAAGRLGGSGMGQLLAMDIGTRTVVGLVVEPRGDIYQVKAVEIEEHRQRVMFDGQIHDIPQVATVVKRVKERLARRLKTELQEAAVAAAGRALRTVKASARAELPTPGPVEPGHVLALEVQAAQEALRQLSGQEERWADYHCVGYSVLQYYLDASPMINLVGQRGNQIGVELVATFLPRVVVDSLYSVVEMAGLQVSSLTLEPIAAAAVVIPPSMRQLNLVLVDIGAGTSDIAISEGGMITGYAMVPVAGDEITEGICRQFLLDFPTAEMVKRALAGVQEVEFTDVVGASHCLPAAEIIAAVEATLNDVARQIAEKIITLNGRSPQAVLCVGGGSRMPGLAACLARCLDLPASRVAVRGLEDASYLQASPSLKKKLRGPEAVTPVGIAVTAYHQQALDLLSVTVNGRPVRLLKGESPRVSDTLLAAGISTRQIYGRPGPGFSVEINGELRLLRGTPGRPAVIKVNGYEASLEDRINFGDAIEVTAAVAGEPPRVLLQDLVPALHGKRINFQGRDMELRPPVFVNGAAADPQTPVPDQAKINCHPLETVADVLAFLDCRPQPGEGIWLNGQLVPPETPVADGDSLEIKPLPAPPANAIEVELNGHPLQIACREGSSVIFSDIFKYIDFPSTPPSGKKTLVMQVNGAAAAFTTPLQAGDRVTLTWV